MFKSLAFEIEKAKLLDQHPHLPANFSTVFKISYKVL